MLFSGEVPAAWRKTLFKMLPKTLKPRTTTDFRPIASFAYMILGRIEGTLETNQPEEQHGFRSKRRLEEHLLTFNVILDKTLEMDQPLLIISLDLSKAFDRVNWESLWKAVGDHGVSQHLVWILQVLYYQQRGTIVGSMENSIEFDIAAGVRQGCVLSPRLFCSVLEWALSKWRARLHGVGYNFQDGGVSLLDLRFGGDILIFAKYYEEIGHVLDVLVDALRQVGLVLNAGKTKILTTQSQHRKLVRAIVGPPGGLAWSAPWHHILHEWNARVLECAEQAGVKLWSRSCLEQHWKLASYIANLSANRWLKRALAWTAGRRTRIGRATNTWDAQRHMYCRWQNLREWRAAAVQTNFWLTHMDSFIEFLTRK